VRLHAEPAAREIVSVGAADAAPAPGVLGAFAEADLVVLPPSNPVVSIGAILAVPGIREALTATPAPVVGLSPIVAGAPVRGMADKVLAAIGVPAQADAVAAHYGARRDGGLLDGWLVDERDAATVDSVQGLGVRCAAVPLLMPDETRAAGMARAALDLAASLATPRP
jgi:LPPG:FO 2-phospho-L-lactate transferase